MSRILCMTLLLAVVVSNSMAGVHAATHVPSDVGECELCASYSDPSDAIPAAGLSIPSVMNHLYVSEFGETAETAPAIINFRQRGPPLTI